MKNGKPESIAQPDQVCVHRARCATSSQQSEFVSMEIDGGRIRRMLPWSSYVRVPGRLHLDLTGFLVLPGLINAHDHLEFALFPRLADRPHPNYIEWGEDIHRKFPDVIALHRAVPKDVRVWWGGIRNLLCGVTTVSHHNPLRPEMLCDDFPVRVICNYGWAHSPALGGDLRAAREATPEGAPFIVHACEGIDEIARQEVWKLDRRGLLDARTVLVHGLALDQSGVALLKERHSSLIVCPSSNQFLFGALPDLSLLSSIENLALGNDSPLTADGDLLDEIRFAIRACNLAPEAAWNMVMTAPAAILRLKNAEGTLQEGGLADLIAIKDTGRDAADILHTLTLHDVELVMIGGRVQLASEAVLKRLPFSARKGLELLAVDGVTRWLRAPVSYLLRRAEKVLGAGQLRLGTRSVSVPASAESCRVG